MAVRFDADGENYTSTSSPPTGSYTVLCWAKLSTDRNTFSTIWASDSSTTNYQYIQTDSDGTSLRAWHSDGSAITGPSMTVGTWYRVALVVSGTTATFYWGTATGALSSAQDTTWPAFSPTPTTFRVGASVFAGEWLNGVVANLKHYTVALSVAELEHELAQYQPRRITSLARFHPFVAVETTDYSGNARTLSGGTGATREDGPPIPWRSRYLTGIPTAAPSSRTLGMATETDTASTLARSKSSSLGAAVETDTAFSFGRTKSAALGTAQETDTAFSVGRTKSSTLTQAIETDSALALTRIRTDPLGSAVETDTASALGRVKSAALGLAVETDTATNIPRAGAIRPVGMASETDTSFSLVRTKSAALGTAAETDSSSVLSRAKSALLGLATETDTAVAPVRTKQTPLGQATETDSAVALDRSRTATLGIAVESDTATAIRLVINVTMAAVAPTATASFSSETVIQGDRVYVIAEEDRQIRVEREPRKFTIASENRSVLVLEGV